MPASEIDDIFAGKIRSVAEVKDKGKQKAASPTTAATSANKKKRKQPDRNDEVTSILDGIASTRGSAELSIEPLKNKKRKKKKENKDGSSLGKDEPGALKIPKSESKPTRMVETIQDPSAGVGFSQRVSSGAAVLATSTKSSKSKSVASKAKTEKAEENNDDVKRFKDSRGTGPRKKTEEGWLVYREDELELNRNGEGTPLCPFDCDCCF